MVDTLDLQLITELQKDGRASYVELGANFNVAEGTVRKRMKRLLKNDIIKIIGVPNLHKLGYGITAFMGIQVRMKDLRRVAGKLAQNPHVCHLSFMTGRYDIIVIVVTKSIEELANIVENAISSLTGVTRTETFVSLRSLGGNWPVLDSTKLMNRLIGSEF